MPKEKPAEIISINEAPLNVPALPAPIRKKTKMAERRFVPALTIKTENGEKFKVPVDASSNAAANQLLVARLRQVFDANLKYISDNKVILEPKMVADLMNSGQKIIEMSESSYTPKDDGPSSVGALTQVGRIAESMMRGAVGAVADGSLAQRMAQIEALGRKQRIVMEEAAIKVEPRAHEKASTPEEPEPPARSDVPQ